MVLLMGATTASQAAIDPNALVVTASNTTSNQLMVYNSAGQLIQTIPTQGVGGASGNSGGIQVSGSLIAVVNSGSLFISLFQMSNKSLQFTQLVPTMSNPVSVAFSGSHLYILGTTTVESHQLYGNWATDSPDGVVSLLKADGSAAQVGVLPGQLIITEKSNMIETVGLLSTGAVNGSATMVVGIPANVNAPFGLITRSTDAYVTIAHANEISLVRNGTVLTVTGSGTQMAPCWLAIEGPYLFSSNSPSMSISRYVVYAQKIIQDAAVAATLNGNPTDIAASDGIVAVVDGSGSVSHLSIFTVDDDGNLTLQMANTINSAINGVAIIPAGI